MLKYRVAIVQSWGDEGADHVKVCFRIKKTKTTILWTTTDTNTDKSSKNSQFSLVFTQGQLNGGCRGAET